MITSMSKRGQISVPAAIRQQFQFKDNQKFEWAIEGDSIHLIPLPDNPVKALRGCMKNLPLLEVLLEERKKDRAHEEG